MVIRKFYTVLLFLIAIIPFKSHSQEVVWDLGFDFFFDNREYDKIEPLNTSQTIFGARLSPEIGIRWDGKHSIMVGGNFITDFGETPFKNNNSALAYYQYNSALLKAYAGIVPRRKLIGEYSPAFFSDSVKYYHTHLSGLLLQYSGDRGYIEFGADWNSMLTDVCREKFLLFSAGRLDINHFYAGFNINMYHHAGTKKVKGVVDNALLYPFVGVKLHEFTPLDIFTVQAGWLQAMQNDREYVDKWVRPGGFQVDMKIEKWKFGIENTFYKGKNLMPHYDPPPTEFGFDYGPGLYWGEPFYRTDNFYNRLELYWQPVRNEIFDLRVSSVHHCVSGDWGWQQKIIFSVYLGQRKFNSKNKRAVL